MRGDHLSPRLEARQGLDRKLFLGDFLRHLLLLLLELEAEHFLLLALDLDGLFRGDGGEQTLDGVEGSVGVVGGEGIHVRPAVADLAEFGDERPGTLPQGATEHRVPEVPHEAQK